MNRIPVAFATLCGLAVAIATPSIAADDQQSRSPAKKAIVVDAPDLFKVPEAAVGPRFSTLLGEEVYSNAGKRLGEIDDFAMAQGGQMYAVIDTSKDPVSDLLDLTKDELVVVPLRELRRSSSFDVRPEASAPAK